MQVLLFTYSPVNFFTSRGLKTLLTREHVRVNTYLPAQISSVATASEDGGIWGG